MNLTQKEKDFYEDTFAKLNQGGQILDEADCIRLLKRGIPDSSICDQIWSIVSDEGNKATLQKDDFFRMLKYLAAYQNSYNINKVNIDELSELPLPNLPKKKKKKGGSKKVGESPQVDPLDNPHVDIPSLPQAAEDRVEQNQAEERARHERDRDNKENIVEVPLTESKALIENIEKVDSQEEKGDQEEPSDSNKIEADKEDMAVSKKSDSRLSDKKEEGEEANISSSVISGKLVNSVAKEAENNQSEELSASKSEEKEDLGENKAPVNEGSINQNEEFKNSNHEEKVENLEHEVSAAESQEKALTSSINAKEIEDDGQNKSMHKEEHVKEAEQNEALSRSDNLLASQQMKQNNLAVSLNQKEENIAPEANDAIIEDRKEMEEVNEENTMSNSQEVSKSLEKEQIIEDMTKSLAINNRENNNAEMKVSNAQSQISDNFGHGSEVIVSESQVSSSSQKSEPHASQIKRFEEKSQVKDSSAEDDKLANSSVSQKEHKPLDNHDLADEFEDLKLSEIKEEHSHLKKSETNPRREENKHEEEYKANLNEKHLKTSVLPLIKEASVEFEEVTLSKLKESQKAAKPENKGSPTLSDQKVTSPLSVHNEGDSHDKPKIVINTGNIAGEFEKLSHSTIPPSVAKQIQEMPKILTNEEKDKLLEPEIHHEKARSDRSDGSTSSRKSSESRRRPKLSEDIIAMSSSKYIEYLEQNQKIKIDINDTQTHQSGFLGYGTYVTYFIRAKYPDLEAFEAERRYSDFDWLNSYFRSSPRYRGLVIPILPEKRTMGNTDPNFILKRRADLEKYLREVTRHEILNKDIVLRIFLGEKGREDFQEIKERKQMSGMTLPELDWNKMKEACEYAVASVKVSFKKESLTSDWRKANEKFNNILKIEGIINKFLKILQEKRELYKTTHTMNANLNVLHTKIMNRVDNEAYYDIGSLSSLIVAKAKNMCDESVVVTDLLREVKIFKVKVDGCKESHSLLTSTLKEIGTNKELHTTKQTKIFEYKSDKNGGNNIGLITKEMNDLEKRVELLEKEVVIIRDNLSLETENLVEQFEIFLPKVLDKFYMNQAEQLHKFSEIWENVSQQSN